MFTSLDKGIFMSPLSSSKRTLLPHFQSLVAQSFTNYKKSSTKFAVCVLYTLTNEVVTDEESLTKEFGIPVLTTIPQIEKPGKDMRKHEKE